MNVKVILSAGALLAAAPAWAQAAPSAEQSADDLVCQLSGECGGLDQLEASQDKPESRGFKLTRKESVVPSPAARVSKNVRAVNVAADFAGTPALNAKPGRSRTILATHPAPATGRANLRVTFVTGSAVLTEAGRREAEKFMTALAAPALTDKRFRIEGHTDSVGSREANVDLSRRRAQAVVAYLADAGLESSRFDVVGYGPDKPLEGLDPAAGANRRVEIVLVP